MSSSKLEDTSSLYRSSAPMHSIYMVLPCGKRVKRCSEVDCSKSAVGKTDKCVTHGGGKRCSEVDCYKSAQGRTDKCKAHGGGVRCSEVDCSKSAVGRSDKCVTHGGGKRCPNCINWIDSRGGCKKYDGWCATCFKRVFPNDPRSTTIREKSWEIKVRNYINSNFEGFIHDIPLWTGNCQCVHRRRVDHRKLIGNTILAIETDERKHSSYDKEDEILRYDDLYMVHSGKWVFIRFNPDSSYVENGVKKNPSIQNRLNVLGVEINKQIKRIEREENSGLLEIENLFYDR
jgi:hypothetical protein